MRLALYQPDIPQNTGSILRLAACLSVPVDIIEPAGFDISDKALRRAGLDYLAHVSLARHRSWITFMQAQRAASTAPRLILLTSKAETRHVDFVFEPTDILLLGRESAGVPESVHRAAAARIQIPIRANLRSLNVAVAAAMVLGEALRQVDGFEPATEA